MNTSQPKRGGFEERLLHELRSVLVGEPASGGRRPQAWVASRAGRRLALAAGVAVIVAVGIGVGLPLLTGGAAPAYAVTSNDDGTVTVQINSLKDAAGLEGKLADAGIRAVVQYLPAGKACKEPWYTPVSQTHGPGHDQAATPGVEHTVDGHNRFTLGNHHPTDATLVITAQARADAGATSVTVAYASAVGTCEIVTTPPGS